MRISDWSSDVCSSDLRKPEGTEKQFAHALFADDTERAVLLIDHRQRAQLRIAAEKVDHLGHMRAGADRGRVARRRRKTTSAGGHSILFKLISGFAPRLKPERQ